MEITKKKVLTFVAIHTRFSWEDLQRYSDKYIKQIAYGISQDKTKSKEVREYAEKIEADEEWMAEEWRNNGKQ